MDSIDIDMVDILREIKTEKLQTSDERFILLIKSEDKAKTLFELKVSFSYFMKKLYSSFISIMIENIIEKTKNEIDSIEVGSSKPMSDELKLKIDIFIYACGIITLKLNMCYLYDKTFSDPIVWGFMAQGRINGV